MSVREYQGGLTRHRADQVVVYFASVVSKSDADLSFGLTNVLYVTFVTLNNVDCVEGGARDLMPYLLSFALRAEGDNRRKVLHRLLLQRKTPKTQQC